MLVTVRKWVAKGTCDMGRNLTTVTLATCHVTVAFTFPGTLARKAALAKAYHSLLAETGHWSPSFLAEVKAAK